MPRSNDPKEAAFAAARRRARARLERTHPDDLTRSDGLRMRLIGVDADLIIALGIRWGLQRTLDRLPAPLAALVRRRLGLAPPRRGRGAPPRRGSKR
jgi:hypothetical protein